MNRYNFQPHFHSTCIQQDLLIFFLQLFVFQTKKPVEFDTQCLFYQKNKSNYTFLSREINNKISSTKQIFFHVEYYFKSVWAFKRIRFGLFADIYLMRGFAMGGLNIIMSILTVLCLGLWWGELRVGMRCPPWEVSFGFFSTKLSFLFNSKPLFCLLRFQRTQKHFFHNSIVRNFIFLSFHCPHTFQPILWWKRQ